MRHLKWVAVAFMAVCLLLPMPAGCNAQALPDQGKTDVSGAADRLSPLAHLTQQIWLEQYPFYQKILAHPYNQELLSGKLDEALFREYIIQDYHFCQNYKKVHALLLAKAPDEAASRFMVNMIGQIDNEIESLHAACIGKYGITEQELTDPPAYPSTELYNAFLIKTAALEPFEVGLMATLPCHWVYYQIGMDMKKSEKRLDNKYQAWIDQYGTAAWENSETKKVVDFVEKYMKATTAENRLKMKQAFVTAMKLEYLFWDGVYNKVKWVK